MNILPDSPTPIETLQKYISRSVQVCIRWIPCVQRQQRVHPTNKNFGHNTFLELNPSRQIRVIHIDPRKIVPVGALLKVTPSVCKTGFDNVYSRSQSIVSNASAGSSDDYWFTRWSRPLAISNNCNCSFRQKWRKSQRNTSISKPAASPPSEGSFHFNNASEVLSLKNTPAFDCSLKKDNLPLNLIKVFAEDFIQDILNDAISQLSHNDLERLGATSVWTKTNPTTENDQTTCTTILATSSASKEALKHGNSVNSSGCVNPSFLASPSDPTANPKPKSCSHHLRRPRKPVLLFLHGAGGSADVWCALLEHFSAAGFEIVAPDMLGHGLSAAPDRAAAYTFQRLLRDALDVFDRFVGEHGKCVVIGHSYGCSLAAALARYRTQVTHLVLISGGGPTPLAPTHLPPMIPCIEGCLKPFVACGFKRERLYAACGKQATASDALGGAPPRVLRLVARGQDWPEGDATFHRRILVPTLLVHGARDPHVALVQQCEMERTIPRSFLELIPNAGHLSMLETPMQLSHMIHCFINWWSR